MRSARLNQRRSSSAMKSTVTIIILLVAECLVYSSATQPPVAYGNCPQLTQQESGLVSRQIFGSNVTVSYSFNGCQSSGTAKDTYRSTTAVVLLNSTGQSDGSGAAEYILAFACNASNRWEPNPTMPVAIPSPNGTEVLSSCSFCTLTPPSAIRDDLYYESSSGCISEF